MTKLGERIEHYRKEMSISQKELGIRCNVGQATISSWEKERTEPNMENIKDLCEVFHITPEVLIYGEDNQTVVALAKKTYWFTKINELTNDFDDEQMSKLYDYALLLSLSKSSISNAK